MTLEENLIKKYSEIFSQTEKQPNWAVRKKSNSKELVHPPIPFVGKNYNNLRILLLASAENLTYYTKQNKEIDYLDYNSIAINRHRFCFENCSENKFFPHMHIEPVNNGALVLIVAYVIKKLKEIEFSNPVELAENIAIGNFGKFSIDTTSKNKDYAGNNSLLSSSIEYFETDLRILEPEIIILPETIYTQKSIREIIHNILPNVIVLPISQITTTTINTQIHKKYKVKNKTELSEWMVYWHEKLSISGAIKGKIKDNYYSVYTYLDEIINKTTIPQQ